MMSYPKDHSAKTLSLIKAIPKEKIGEWLLKFGYYPEQYVVPPCFSVKEFELQDKPYYKVRQKTNGKTEFEVKSSEPHAISFPKSQFTDTSFGIIHPKIYHDIVWYMLDSWDDIIKHLFDEESEIYSYSFPISLDSMNEGKIGRLRSGRMIYEFLEMAENDLVAESYKYSKLLKSDVKNFFPSIYTHSISWALHTKEEARKDKSYNLVGNKLDKLCQYSNDRCTNGLIIGSAISDLISEIVISAVDKQISSSLKSDKIDFLAVRYKDDYRFLCKTDADADKIIKTIQKNLNSYNLQINESKTQVLSLPDGLYRKWTIAYYKVSPKKDTIIEFKAFENAFLCVLQIDTETPGTGMIERFLSDLINKKESIIKVIFDSRSKVAKFISLMFQLRDFRINNIPFFLKRCYILHLIRSDVKLNIPERKKWKFSVKKSDMR